MDNKNNSFYSIVEEFGQNMSTLFRKKIQRQARSFASLVAKAQKNLTAKYDGGPQMDEAFVITIDIAKLRYQMSRQQERIVTEHEVHGWLCDVGFVDTPEGWIAKESALAKLNILTIKTCRRIA